METTLSEANALLRIAGLDTLSRDASANEIAAALADAAQVLDAAEVATLSV